MSDPNRSSLPLADPGRRQWLIIAGIALVVLLVFLAVMAGRDGVSRGDVRAANELVQEKEREVAEARRELDEAEAELRQARAEAEAEAARLETELTKDTMARP